jgi:DNA mismatch repair protein MutS
MALSPMMQQYKEIKERYSDCLLMFRLGDFYELFFDDAKTASRELELTLTGKNCGLEERAPMCGVPFHAADSYIAKLVERGYKVAICEQMEDPALAKGLVKRDVIRVVTPGTLDIAGAADSGENIYIASICRSRERTALSFADITTGEFSAVDLGHDKGDESLMTELGRIDPREIILCSGSYPDLVKKFETAQFGAYINEIDESYFRMTSCIKALEEQFDVTSLMPLGIDGRDEMTIAAGSLLLYLTETQKQTPAQIRELKIRDTGNHMILDRSTMRNLELLETLYDKKVKGSLLGVLDRTKTAMGARMLKRSMKEPLNDSAEINRRLDAVEALTSDQITRSSITASLRHIYDFERLTARVASGRANGKDLSALKTTLGVLPDLTDQLGKISTELIDEIRGSISDFSSLYKMIDDAIVEDPPFIITEGGLIKDGYSEDLDALKASIKDAKDWITGLEAAERERTGIKSLKVGFNKVFGYYIDVSKANTSLVPDDYVRKQTLVNSERYITPELKEKENIVLSAEAKINSMEYDIFRSVRSAVEPYISDLQKASGAVALLDMLTGFADAAVSGNWCRPVVDDSSVIKIKGGRHPSVEQIIGEGMFVSNDVDMDAESRSMLIITGPNMSGKSTYMRQTAIIVLMAQMGAFVPCESAHIGVVDRVFTRIGASDNLAYGQSTFYVEMSELANILRNATSRSLIILDEIGRGTSTFDGLSIAWATIEYLCRPGKTIRTMFATHYHELTSLESRYDCIHNLSVAVSESGSNVVFLHKIIDGPASKSYGIHVAKIAGVPREIRKNAQAKLKELEAQSLKSRPASEQLTIFTADIENSVESRYQTDEEAAERAERYEELADRIRDLDLNDMTPFNALLTLKDLQDSLSEGER